MSRAAPQSHEPVGATPRKRLSVVERGIILDRQDDRCIDCRETLVWAVVDGKLIYGPMIDEHIIPLELGGSNDLSNRELRCVPCAKKKTTIDRKNIAKVHRLLKRKDGTRRPRKAISSKGFDRTKTRKFNGQVVPRQSGETSDV